jgi:hypothetical protein
VTLTVTTQQDTQTPKLTPLDERILEQLATIVYNDYRPASFLDFRNLSASHGVIRNSLCRLKKHNKVKLAYNCGTAFYTLPSQPFVKAHTVTPGGYGGRQSHNGHLVAEFTRLPFDERALHDLRLLFSLPGSWDLLSSTARHRLHPSNKDVQLEPFRSRDGKTVIRITVHRTDNISVYLACSLAPIVENYDGVFRLGNELTRAEEYLARELERAAIESGHDSNVATAIPDHLTWICKHYHLGRDSKIEFAGDRFNVSYEDMQGTLCRVYSKAHKDKKCRIRVERLESPNRPLQEIINAILDRRADCENRRSAT